MVKLVPVKLMCLRVHAKTTLNDPTFIHRHAAALNKKILMGHSNPSIPVDAHLLKVMVSTNCSIIGQHAALNFMAQ